MPESDASISAEGGKTVTIQIYEMTASDLANPSASEPGDNPNVFVIQNGKYRLTITIAE